MIATVLMAVGISLSGVLGPGPMTAATLAAGTRRAHAGTLIALGHLVIEFPLLLLIMAGTGKLLEMPAAKTGIGLVGGAVLLLMGAQLLIGLCKADEAFDLSGRRHPFWTGVILTVANPLFLVWWATVGLKLAIEVRAWGLLAFALFAVLHWLCDLAWLEALSLTSFKGSKLLGQRSQKVVLAICAAMLLYFGGKFIYEATVDQARGAADSRLTSSLE